MKFAVSYSTAFHGADPDRIAGFARHAEECGFEGIYLPEHVVLQAGGTIPPGLPFLDPLDCLSFVAAATRTISLGTGVLLLPYHHPVVLAKRVATVDVLSGGRLRLFTVGLGSLPAEARAVGVDFGSRGRRADEAIDVLRLLWGGGEEGVSFHGEFFDFDGLCSFPKPMGGSLPIHIGGSSRAAARRAGLRGDGYFAGGMLPPRDRMAQLELARRTATEAGRPAPEYTRWGSIDMTSEAVEGYAEQGVTRLVVAPGVTEPEKQLSSFAKRFI